MNCISKPELVKNDFMGRAKKGIDYQSALNPDEYVDLPTRPKNEVPAEWAEIQGPNQSQLDRAKALIQGELTPWLEKNCRDKI